MALSAYRHVLRSTSIAFQGDVRVLHAARAQARNGFETHRSFPPTSPEVETHIAHAEEVARILRENIVQGQKAGNEEDKFQLRIHENTERGDNGSIKRAQNSSGPGTIATGCCSAT